VTEAYEILSDEKRRKMYDQFGHAGVDPNFSGEDGRSPFNGGFDFGDGSFHFSGGTGGAQEIDPEELFDMFFGGGGRSRRQRGPRRGADLQSQLHVTFKEAVFGCKKEVNLRYQTVNRENGKTKNHNRKVQVDIPAGIETGMSIRVPGKGAEGDPGASPGNLLVQVLVEEDKNFVRQGNDVHTEVPISVIQAILGGTVDVKTLEGEVEMKVPKGCQPDTKLMLRGKGIPEINSQRKGHQIVHLKIEIPTNITARQEEILREFDEETKKSGLGLCGRIAHAADSAFEKMFGKKNKGSEKAKDSSNDSDDDDDGKKQAAQ
jgi:molecular chaperone DnaJ